MGRGGEEGSKFGGFGRVGWRKGSRQGGRMVRMGDGGKKGRSPGDEAKGRLKSGWVVVGQ